MDMTQGPPLSEWPIRHYEPPVQARPGRLLRRCARVMGLSWPRRAPTPFQACALSLALLCAVAQDALLAHAPIEALAFPAVLHCRDLLR